MTKNSRSATPWAVHSFEADKLWPQKSCFFSWDETTSYHLPPQGMLNMDGIPSRCSHWTRWRFQLSRAATQQASFKRTRHSTYINWSENRIRLVWLQSFLRSNPTPKKLLKFPSTLARKAISLALPTRFSAVRGPQVLEGGVREDLLNTGGPAISKRSQPSIRYQRTQRS